MAFSGDSYGKRSRYLLLLITAGYSSPCSSYRVRSFSAVELPGRGHRDIRCPRYPGLPDRGPAADREKARRGGGDGAVRVRLDPNGEHRDRAPLRRGARPAARTDRDRHGRRQAAGSSGVEAHSTEELAALSRIRLERTFLSDWAGRLAPFYRQRIVADRENFAADRRHGILVIDPGTAGSGGGDYSSCIDLAPVRRSLAAMRLTPGGLARDLELLKGVMLRMISPTSPSTGTAPTTRRGEARAAVRPVLFKMKRGEMIVRVGERVSSEQAMKLEKIFKSKSLTPVVTGDRHLRAGPRALLRPLPLRPQEHQEIQPDQQGHPAPLAADRGQLRHAEAGLRGLDRPGRALPHHRHGELLLPVPVRRKRHHRAGSSSTPRWRWSTARPAPPWPASC